MTGRSLNAMNSRNATLSQLYLARCAAHGFLIPQRPHASSLPRLPGQ